MWKIILIRTYARARVKSIIRYIWEHPPHLPQRLGHHALTSVNLASFATVGDIGCRDFNRGDW
jgi:hypothetical protein